MLAGVDFDRVITGGGISSFAEERIKRLSSYTERSVSGGGLHVIVRARPLQSGVAHGGVEAYTSGRFFTMTGRAPAGARIVASSGFGPEKCRMMAAANAPIDIVGTGSYLPELWSETYATADIIAYDGKPMVKAGREFLLRGKR